MLNSPMPTVKVPINPSIKAIKSLDKSGTSFGIEGLISKIYIEYMTKGNKKNEKFIIMIPFCTWSQNLH